jgi:hypothetical protein
MIADLGDGRPDGSILQRALSQVPAPQHRRIAVDILTEKITSSQPTVLILPAKGPSFVESYLRTRTILDAPGRCPDLTVK